ncbi:alpha-ketoglutarate-dependent dioxygenase alkB homolog 4-like [Glandiceps talaboti]
MESIMKQCGCKGIRTCLVCENTIGTERNSGVSIKKPSTVYVFCQLCRNKAWIDPTSHSDHSSGSGDSVEFPGVLLVENFVTMDEEAEIVQQIDCTPWKDSQSGRRKQDYGPKVNFKKRKVNHRPFTGLPEFSKTLVHRMSQVEELNDFKVVEQCNLEYVPTRGSAIDPHFDDFWLWGERLVTLNLLSSTVLTMTKPNSSTDQESDLRVDIHLPRRSLVIVYGPARYDWMHAIHRQDITSRRIAITFRELSSEFCHGGAKADVGNELVEIAKRFSGTAVQ